MVILRVCSVVLILFPIYPISHCCPASLNINLSLMWKKGRGYRGYPMNVKVLS